VNADVDVEPGVVMGRLRVLVCVLGLDQHEAGALAIAQLLRDSGMEVIYAGRFNLPDMIASIAEQEDVDVVGVSCHSWEFLYYAGELSGLLRAMKPAIPVVIGGSVVTRQDRTRVLELGIDDAVLPDEGADVIVETFKRLAAGAGAA
jgi:methylmalonyl-CoA mutase C-terminal domain/subunit